MSPPGHRLKSLATYPVDLLARLVGRIYRRWRAIEARQILKELRKAGTNVSMGEGCIFHPLGTWE